MSENALQKIEPMPMAAVEPTTPHALMRRATDVAGVCREIVLKTACEIQGRKFVKVEGWESIATAHGCFVGAEDAKRAYDKEGNHIGYEARSVMRNSHGDIIATGEGFVGFDEKDRKGNATWKNRAEYAGRAMAQTRSISRVCRSVFAHVVVLIDAGLSTTPAEEVPEGGFDDNERAARAKPAKVPHGPTPTQKPTKPAQATEKTKAWFLAEMRKRFDEQVLLQFFIDRNPAYILPNETLEDIHLDRVPTTRQALDEMVAECAAFMQVEPRVVNQSEQSTNTPVTSKTPENTVSPHSSAGSKSRTGQSEKESGHSGGSSDLPEDQPWFDAIVPVPHKGMKRDEYLRAPDTIGELYNLRHDDDQARRRLFGFVHNYEPKGWTGRDGKPRPPSDADKKFRDDLDAFYAWFEENHADECNND